MSQTSGAPGDGFGSAIGVVAEWLAVGAPDVGGTGTVHVLRRDGAVWDPAQVLVALDGAPGHGFGSSLALGDDLLVVGAPGANAAYVFERTGSVWAEVAKLAVAGGPVDAGVGTSVSLAGETVVVGAPNDDGVVPGAGGAYVFERAGSTWGQTAQLVAADGALGDGFGRGVSTDGETIVVGALDDDDAGGESGAVYVFERDGTGWVEEQKLAPTDVAAGDKFGAAVAVLGGRLIAGSPLDDDDGTSSGAVYVFERVGASWAEVFKLKTADAAGGDRLGSAVALAGEMIVAASPLSDDFGLYSGSVHAFTWCGGGWSERKLLACVGAAGDAFGFAVGVAGEVVVGGAPLASEGEGVAYVHELSLSSGPGCVFCLCSLGVCGNEDPEAGCANELGEGARISALGSANPDTVDLLAFDAVPGQFGVFFEGDVAVSAPFGNGRLCVGGRVIRLQPPVAIGAGGEAGYGPGFGNPAISSVTGVVPGSGATRFYQFWYRDPGGVCGGGFNVSSGYSVTW